MDHFVNCLWNSCCKLIHNHVGSAAYLGMVQTEMVAPFEARVLAAVELRRQSCSSLQHIYHGSFRCISFERRESPAMYPLVVCGVFALILILRVKMNKRPLQERLHSCVNCVVCGWNFPWAAILQPYTLFMLWFSYLTFCCKGQSRSSIALAFGV